MTSRPFAKLVLASLVLVACADRGDASSTSGDSSSTGENLTSGDGDLSATSSSSSSGSESSGSTGVESSSSSTGGPGAICVDLPGRDTGEVYRVCGDPCEEISDCPELPSSETYSSCMKTGAGRICVQICGDSSWCRGSEECVVFKPLEQTHSICV